MMAGDFGLGVAGPGEPRGVIAIDKASAAVYWLPGVNWLDAFALASSLAGVEVGSPWLTYSATTGLKLIVV